MNYRFDTSVWREQAPELFGVEPPRRKLFSSCPVGPEDHYDLPDPAYSLLTPLMAMRRGDSKEFTVEDCKVLVEKLLSSVCARSNTPSFRINRMHTTSGYAATARQVVKSANDQESILPALDLEVIQQRRSDSVKKGWPARRFTLFLKECEFDDAQGHILCYDQKRKPYYFGREKFIEVLDRLVGGDMLGDRVVVECKCNSWACLGYKVVGRTY